MSLMINLDDAIGIIRAKLDTYGGQINLCEDDLERLRNDLEQKCYVFADQDEEQNAKMLRVLLDRVNVHAITRQIQKDNLNNWCNTWRNNAAGYLALITHEKHT